MTNNQGVIQPQPGFHADLRRVTREHGTLLALDETHTQMCGPGGLTGRWGLESDLLVTGKSIGGGVPVGAYGMTSDLAGVMGTGSWGATGGTLFGSALQMAACRATLEEVLVDDAYDEPVRLGRRIADGIDELAAATGLPWRAHRLFNRSGYCFTGTQPRNAAEARADLDPDLYATWRLYAANRGVWEAIEGSGPAAGVAHTDADVDLYLDVLGDFVREIAR
jgi:glutamate-1-semialdehyde 2,1-aminomutase